LKRSSPFGYTLFVFAMLFVFIVSSFVLVPNNVVNEIDLEKRLLPPNPHNVLGTDNLGRDLGLMIVAGTRNTLIIVFVSLALSIIIGLFLGVLAAISTLFSVIIDKIMILVNTIPIIFIIAIIAVKIGPGVLNIILALFLYFLPLFYRIIKTMALSLMAQPYIEAVKALGASYSYILVHYILKEVAPYILSLFVFNIPTSIALEMAVNFIGVGLDSSTPSLGTIIGWGVRYFTMAPHILIISTAVSIVLILALSVLVEKTSKVIRNL